MLHGAGRFTYIYSKNGPNVGKYSIHGASGNGIIHSIYGLFFVLITGLTRAITVLGGSNES